MLKNGEKISENEKLAHFLYIGNRKNALSEIIDLSYIILEALPNLFNWAPHIML